MIFRVSGWQKGQRLEFGIVRVVDIVLVGIRGVLIKATTVERSGVVGKVVFVRIWRVVIVGLGRLVVS